MHNTKNNIPHLILLTLVLVCTGCTVERPVEGLFPPEQPAKTVSKSDMPGRFQDQTVAGISGSAARSAIELSAKYTKAVEQATVLKAENEKLIEENEQLKNALAPCQTDLTQAQKELAEANDLLIEMRIEMNNWKTNILGFREEMRNAENAQLDALVKILEVLGGQAKTDAAGDPDILPEKTAPAPAETARGAKNTAKKVNG